MINEKTDVLSEVYLIEIPNKTRRGLVVLSSGKSIEVPVEVLKLFDLSAYHLN